MAISPGYFETPETFAHLFEGLWTIPRILGNLGRIDASQRWIRWIP